MLVGARRRCRPRSIPDRGRVHRRFQVQYGDRDASGVGGPAPGLDRAEEGVEGPIEQLGLLQIDGVAGPGNDGQAGRGQQPLQIQAGVDADMILVAGQDQGRHFHPSQWRGQIGEQRPAGDGAPQGLQRAVGGTHGETLLKRRIGGRVLVTEPPAVVGQAVVLGNPSPAPGLDVGDELLDLGFESRLGAGGVPGTGTADGQRTRHLRMAESEVQGGHRTHRNPDDMRCLDAEMTHQASHVLDGLLLGIGIEGFRRLGRREAACVVDDAAVARREVGDLAGEAAAIVGELVGEDDGVPLTGLLVVERNAVDGRLRHDFEHPCGGAP